MKDCTDRLTTNTVPKYMHVTHWETPISRVVSMKSLNGRLLSRPIGTARLISKCYVLSAILQSWSGPGLSLRLLVGTPVVWHWQHPWALFGTVFIIPKWISQNDHGYLGLCLYMIQTFHTYPMWDLDFHPLLRS